MRAELRRAGVGDRDALGALWARAVGDLGRARGGPALLADLLADRSSDAALTGALEAGELWWAEEDGRALALAWRRGPVLVAVYVDPERRREGVARALVSAMLAEPDAPSDGYALPGDRATKSLYESLGWKARLLTMRAG